MATKDSISLSARSTTYGRIGRSKCRLEIRKKNLKREIKSQNAFYLEHCSNLEKEGGVVEKKISTEEDKNKPDRAKMRPDCVSACIENVTCMKRQMTRQE